MEQVNRVGRRGGERKARRDGTGKWEREAGVGKGKGKE